MTISIGEVGTQHGLSPRKIIQLITHHRNGAPVIVGLANDGTVWVKELGRENGWELESMGTFYDNNCPPVPYDRILNYSSVQAAEWMHTNE